MYLPGVMVISTSSLDWPSMHAYSPASPATGEVNNIATPLVIPTCVLVSDTPSFLLQNT